MRTLGMGAATACLRTPERPHATYLQTASLATQFHARLQVALVGFQVTPHLVSCVSGWLHEFTMEFSLQWCGAMNPASDFETQLRASSA